MAKNQEREKLLKLLMEAQMLIEKKLTLEEVYKTLRYYDLSLLKLALGNNLPDRMKKWKQTRDRTEDPRIEKALTDGLALLEDTEGGKQK